MKFTSSVLAAALVLAGSSFSVYGFMFTKNSVSPSCSSSSTIRRNGSNDHPNGRRLLDSRLYLSPEDLTNYMAKAHEDKIRALKEIEDKKNAEIKALKGEVESLKQNSSVGALATTPASGNMDFSSMTKEELAAKLVSYQQFMAKYIVEAQQQKMLAMKAAEAATKAKYEEKLKLLGGSSDSRSTAAPLAMAAFSPETKLYDERTANVAAAAKAGKSRWGDQEVAKATQAVNGVKVNGGTVPAKVTVTASPITATTIPSGTGLYNYRNAMVAAAGAAGKSRWGAAEVKKATEEAAKNPALAASALRQTAAPIARVVVTPEIEAADHGLRNDGGVGGPSLAERVNLGMQLFEALRANGVLAPPAPTANGSAATSLFQARNARVAAAAAAGKSRWGPMENEKSAQLAGAAALPPGAPSAGVVITTPPEVIEADHGLRADGGVGGPTLAQRVNLGAKLLSP